MPDFITPCFPPEAETQARQWQASRNMPVFTWAMQNSGCPNCGGEGVVYLRLADKGPFKAPLIMKVMAFFEGDGQFRRGWYTIKDTLGFACPMCNK